MALTGGLASGKSTVAAGLARRGASVLDADRVVHRLYQPGGEGARAVRELLGDQVLAADGGVDRAVLGRRVLSDAEALHRLNRTIHPLVRREIDTWLDDLSGRTPPARVAVVEAALLIETGSYRDYDLLVVVWCRAEQQLARAVGRGMVEQRAQQMLAVQMPLDEKRRLADVLIDSSGTFPDLEAELDRAWREIDERCTAVTS